MRHLPRHFTRLFQLESGRPAVSAGVRAALALGVPLLVSVLLHRPAASWAGLAGLFVTLVDKGGPYRSRAAAMGTLTLLGALSGLIIAIPSTLWVDVALTCVWVTACGFARSYGDTPGIVGALLANLFVVSLALPARGPSGALLQAGFFVLGGAWAMLLALVLWPLRPYRPVRRAIAACYRALADKAEAMAGWPLDGLEARSWLTESARHNTRIRQSLETARAALASTRLGRQEESGRGEHLLVLLEGVDALFLLLTALTEALDLAPREARYRAVRFEAQRTVASLAEDVRELAHALEKDNPRGLARASWDAERVSLALRELGAEGASPDLARAHYAHVAELLGRLREYSAAALDVASRLEKGEPLPERDPRLRAPRAGASRGRSWLAPLRDNLRAESIIFRHALRLGLTAAVATALGEGLGLNHWYWVTITVIVVLQPYAGFTLQKGLQRVAGTLLGGALAVGVVALVRDQPVLLLLSIVLLVGVSVSLKPLNFTAYQVLLVPALLLLAEMQSGDWHLTGVRILNTLLGGALALLGMRLLWPSPEQLRFPEQVATVLRADRDYLREVATQHVLEEVAVSEARRKVGLALLAAEASFQRLLGEWKGPAHELEPVMALLTYARRFGAAVTALAATRAWHGTSDLSPLVDYASRALDELAEALVAPREPRPLPRTAPRLDGGDPLARTQEERLVRQLTVLHHAVERVPPGLRAPG